MTNKPWLLYGCTGYSGKLITRESHRQGLTPIIAGRSEHNVKALAERYGFEYRVFDLDKPEHIEQAIEGCHLIFNAAGPFTQTCEPLLKACLKKGVHNLSLVGEIPLLETLYRYNQRAKDAGIALAVGLGYDVIPTDCIANVLKQALPDATHLTIAMQGASDMSPGSTKEMVEQLGEQPFWQRKNGNLVEGKTNTKMIDVGLGKTLAMAIAWGDISTAYHSTGIANIEVYAALSRGEAWMMQAVAALKPVIRIKRVQGWINRLIDRFVDGPDDDTLEQTPVYFLGEANNAKGNAVRATLKTASGYKLTYLGAVYGIRYVLENEIQPGYQTPAQLMGNRSIEHIDGSSEITLS